MHLLTAYFSVKVTIIGRKIYQLRITFYWKLSLQGSNPKYRSAGVYVVQHGSERFRVD